MQFSAVDYRLIKSIMLYLIGLAALVCLFKWHRIFTEMCVVIYIKNNIRFAHFGVKHILNVENRLFQHRPALLQFFPLEESLVPLLCVLGPEVCLQVHLAAHGVVHTLSRKKLRPIFKTGQWTHDI